MNRCEVCGNTYDNLLEVVVQNEGIKHYFDCIECAAHRLAPKCRECGVKILGHGVQVGVENFCGAHCARVHGHSKAVDHIDELKV